MKNLKFENKMITVFAAFILVLSSAEFSLAEISIKESSKADIKSEVRSYSNTGSNFSTGGSAETGDAKSSSYVRVETGSSGENNVEYDVKAEANGKIAETEGKQDSPGNPDEKSSAEDDGAEAGVSISSNQEEKAGSSLSEKMGDFFRSIAGKIRRIFNMT